MSQTPSTNRDAPGARVAWLDGTAPPLACGVSWGVPWPRGTVSPEAIFELTDARGVSLPLQAWPLAFWPDGSLKWSGLATTAGPEAEAQLTVGVREPDAARAAGSSGGSDAAGLTVRQTDSVVVVDTGPMQCTISTRGADLITSLCVDGTEVAGSVGLACVRQDGPDGEADDSPARVRCVSDVRHVDVEQCGPERAVIRLEGVHRSADGAVSWLPFVVRLYLYAGTTQVRIVHTIVYDGDPQRDVIRGLGVVARVPLRAQVHNRHVRFVGEADGLWCEPVQPLFGSRHVTWPGEEAPSDARWTRTPGKVFPRQLAGEHLPDRDAFSEDDQRLLDNFTVWDDFKLTQLSADSFAVHKRTNPDSCWLHAGRGGRAAGLAFVGDTGGGLAVGIKDFWQSFPAGLEIRGAAGDTARLHAWLWSPDAPAMDVRHYDTKGHTLEATYEDSEPGFFTPHGVARTSELTVWACAALPEREQTLQQAQLSARPPHLVCSPQHLHASETLGVWGLPDRASPAGRWVEDKLDQIVEFYQDQIEQRRWYGFWDYGDVMHDYDYARHVWRYDIGGFAWDNTECASDLWLWLCFLRSGRADHFRLAEAMTRHTGDVDMYHLGRFDGLGSRHNVRHWGCGAKEVRISQALTKRPHHYLTTDERTGDVMREVVDVDRTLIELDPMRKAQPASGLPTDLPARLRAGPDWLALAGNWMTEWERTGQACWRDKILAGVESLAREPHGFFSGSIFGYDPQTGVLRALRPDALGGHLLLTIMGGAEVGFELSRVLDEPAWHHLWNQLCTFYCAEPETVREAFGRETTLGGRSYQFARLPAFAGAVGDDAQLRRQAWDQLLAGDPDRLAGMFTRRRVQPPEVLHPVDEGEEATTNQAAMWSLNAIQVLDLARDEAPATHPLWAGR